MNKRPHGTIEDIGAEIGYTAASALTDWFGGGKIWVPVEATEKSPLAAVIGLPALRRLVTMYEGFVGNDRLVRIPCGHQQTINRRDREIADMLTQGVSPRIIGREKKLTTRHVQRIRRRLEEDGVLPVSLRQKPVKHPGRKKKTRNDP